MSAKFLFIILLLVGLSLSYSFSSYKKILSEGLKGKGNVTCAACTIVVGLLEQMALIHNNSVEQEVDKVCDLFPAEFKDTCIYFVDNYGADVIKYLDAHQGPDKTCQYIDFCSYPQCQLFPEGFHYYNIDNNGKNLDRRMLKRSKNAEKFRRTWNVKFNPWDWIVKLVNRLANNHLPVVDIDNDRFSTVDTLRGANWRGRDCNDFLDDVYAGRKVPLHNPDVDHNCNGIFGTINGSTWEERLCTVQNLGVIVLGDSAGAHFEIPPQYLNASEIQKGTYDGLLDVLSDEFDWPQRSAYTSYEVTPSDLPMDSVYKFIKNRNRCNHRDYQNLGVNGARSGAMAGKDGLVTDIARNQTLDHPALVFLELVGNDVCDGHHDYQNSMTTVEEFRANILSTLDYLNSTLPKGSHVVMVGLAQGGILWDSLHNRTHPIGVTYKRVYDFLNCLYISPCYGWMNSNETIRNFTSERAANLSLVYPQIVNTTTYVNFDMAFIEFPLDIAIKMWHAKGGETWQLIEPCDGFHPNQIANSLFGQIFVSLLQQNHPTFLGQENPNNYMIQYIFGDQGGY
eukprot:TRINITY_DN4991_c0_g1_i1.p1 TRINITY_DN4991_c0_g1~~TRINITY_DN4991_c0_g1_i1.p1  ORF type:complete len:566 (-),score=151.84 TRINITY_DN4991_c0_g1_i1:74-1771(-)